MLLLVTRLSGKLHLSEVVGEQRQPYDEEVTTDRERAKSASGRPLPTERKGLGGQEVPS
jgi:hypothetical protein